MPVAGSLVFRDLTTSKIVYRVPQPPDDAVQCLALNAAGTYLACSGKRPFTSVYLVSRDTAVKVLELPFRSNAAVFSHHTDKLFLLHGKSFMGAKLSGYDLHSLKPFATDGVPSDTKQLTISANDSLLAIAEGGIIRTLHTTNLKTARVYWEKQQQDLLVFNPEKTAQCASVTQDNIVQVRDLDADTVLTEIRAHTAKLQLINYSPDGNSLFTLDRSGRLFAWSLREKSCVAMKDHLDRVPFWDAHGNLLIPNADTIALVPLSVKEAPGKAYFEVEERSPVDMLPQPVIGYTPETGVLLGIGVSLLVNADTGKYYRPSLYSVAAAYGFKGRQIQLGIGADVYTRSGWHITADLSYHGHDKNYYFGIGSSTHRSEKKEYISNTFRLHSNIFKLIGSRFSAGISYDLRHDSRAVFDDKDISHVPGEAGGTLIGLGPAFRYDSRDNTLFPTSGSLLDINFQQYGWLNMGNYQYQKILIDYRKYFPLGRTANASVLAVQGLVDATWNGTVPFYGLPYFTGDRTFRGIWRNLYIDQQIVALQAEFRSVFSKADPRFGYAIFAGIADGANDFFRNYTTDVKVVYGLGFRTQVLPKKRMYARLDYAMTSKGDYGVFGGIGVSF